MGAERLGDRDGVQPAERPDLVAVEVVGPHDVAAGGDQLGARVVLPDERGRPVGALVPVDPPALRPGRGVEGDDERLIVVVVDDEEGAVVEHRRSGRAPAQARLGRIELPFPDHRAAHVEREDADVAEVGVDPLSVGHRGRRGEGVLEVPVEPGRAGVDLRGPDDRAGLDVQGVDQPVVQVPFPLHQIPRLGGGEPAVGHLLGRAVGEVEPHARLLGLSFADHAGQKDAVAPNDRRRPAEPVDRRLPHDVVGRAPGEGKARVVVGPSPAPSAPRNAGQFSFPAARVVEVAASAAASNAAGKALPARRAGRECSVRGRSMRRIICGARDGMPPRTPGVRRGGACRCFCDGLAARGGTPRCTESGEGCSGLKGALGQRTPVPDKA